MLARTNEKQANEQAGKQNKGQRSNKPGVGSRSRLFLFLLFHLLYVVFFVILLREFACVRHRDFLPVNQAKRLK